MRKEYDFSGAVKNPYICTGKQLVTIRLEPEVIDYFKQIGQELKQPYQTLINSYLVTCVRERRRPVTTWEPESRAG